MYGELWTMCRSFCMIEPWTGPQEIPVLFFVAKSHYPFDACTVIPAAVEKHNLPRGRKMGYIPLEIPLGFFLFSWHTQGNHPANPRIQPLCDPFDGSSLPGGIPPFKYNNYPETLFLNPLVHFYQFGLEPLELIEIKLLVQLLMIFFIIRSLVVLLFMVHFVAHFYLFGK